MKTAFEVVLKGKLKSAVSWTLFYFLGAIALQGCGNSDLTRDMAQKILNDSDHVHGLELETITMWVSKELVIQGNSRYRNEAMQVTEKYLRSPTRNKTLEQTLKKYGLKPMSMSAVRAWHSYLKSGLLKDFTILPATRGNFAKYRFIVYPEWEWGACVNKPNYKCTFASQNCEAKEVTGIRGNENTKMVEFRMHCTPTPEGQLLSNKKESVQRRTAKFNLYDDGWRVTNLY